LTRPPAILRQASVSNDGKYCNALSGGSDLDIIVEQQLAQSRFGGEGFVARIPPRPPSRRGKGIVDGPKRLADQAVRR
jgi:hypothetical protein